VAALATQDVNFAGLTPAYAAATAGGDTFVPDGDTFLHFKNTGGSINTVTIVTPGSPIGLALADVVVAVPATTGDKMIGPFPANWFADSTGSASITYSGVTGLTVACVRPRIPVGA
jgi:hypothetical protein